MLCLGYDRNTSNTTTQGLMAPQRSSLHTSFRALSITRKEIKESVIYDGRPQGYLSSKARISRRERLERHDSHYCRLWESLSVHLTVSKPRCNFVALLSPGLKASARTFGELAPPPACFGAPCKPHFSLSLLIFSQLINICPASVDKYLSRISRSLIKLNGFRKMSAAPASRARFVTIKS
jgi:hypothetical protein